LQKIFPFLFFLTQRVFIRFYSVPNKPINIQERYFMDWFSRAKLTRRDLLKGAVAAAALPKMFFLSSYSRPSVAYAAGDADLVVAQQGTPTQLLQAAMAPLGGMGRFVKKGQRVVIKANIAWARTPEQAATNNPELLSALIKMCYQAGAKRGAVWDHTCDNAQFCFSRVPIL
jgi:hypothetical protein